jgi:hypothetical protein
MIIILPEQTLLPRTYCAETRLKDENQNQNENKWPIYGTALFILFSFL